MALQLELGYDVIRNYKRLSYKAWYALAEFVDNSTQSYYNHRETLDADYRRLGEKLQVRIIYDRDAGLIRVTDNAMGMSHDELQWALVVGKPPIETSGRSQFGLGLKTAATWFGNRWKITTKKLGEPYEYEVVVDVEKVAEGQNVLDEREPVAKTPALHYTILEISDLNARLAPRTIGSIKKYLRSMYRIDVRAGVLDLYYEDNLLTLDDELVFMEAADGTKYRMDFEFDVGAKHVSGWIGILGAGSSGRPNAGFTQIRRGRMIRGWPDSWRPESIFGQIQGSNNLINQRIAGEIHLDDFEVSHTKDDIQWMGNEQEEVEEKLAEIAIDYINIARVPRKGLTPTGPSEAEVQAAVDELREELSSKEFIDLIELQPIPDPDVVRLSGRPMIEAAVVGEPRFTVEIGDIVTCKLFLATDASPMDLYYDSDAATDNSELCVVVNANHPHWWQLGDSESVLTYLRQCVYDAVAEWQCRRKTGAVQSDTIKGLKDGLLRLPSRIESAGA